MHKDATVCRIACTFCRFRCQVTVGEGWKEDLKQGSDVADKKLISCMHENYLDRVKPPQRLWHEMSFVAH